MAQLIVDDVKEELLEELKLRAARNGQSPEEELRQILQRALVPPQQDRPSFRDLLGRMPNVGEDEDFARDPDPGRPVEL